MEPVEVPQKRLWALIEDYAEKVSAYDYESDQGVGNGPTEAQFERDEALRQLIKMIGDRPK